MTAERVSIATGARVYGLGVMWMGLLCLLYDQFDPGQPVPKDFPFRDELAYAAGAFMFLAGLAMQWRRTIAWSAAALSLYYTFVVVILMGGPGVIRNHTQFLVYSNTAGPLAIAAAALIVYAACAQIDATLAARFIRAGQLVFGVCAVLFGVAHFVYMDFTAPLVPKWLPPSQEFWGYATGVGHIAAGVAILTGVQASLAAILLTAMYASFIPLAHGPMLVADPSKHYTWTETAVTLAFTGAAWVVADSMARPRR